MTGLLLDRYGLPVSYQVILLQPDRKCVKKLRELLSSLFTHLDPAAAASKPDVSGLLYLGAEAALNWIVTTYEYK